MDFNTLHKQRKFIMIAALVGAIGTFLNWFTWDTGFISGGIAGTSFGAGIITLIALIAAGVLAYLGNQKNNLDKNSWLIVLGASALASILCVIKLISGAGNGFGGSIGIGLILSAIGAVATLAASYIFRNPNDDLKQSLSDMKKQVENKIDNDPNT
jgi:4-amino-4-deoxy-L-arabinose transferase-like glycosyltransferase